MDTTLARLRPRLYYGWYIAGLAFAAQFIGGPYVFGVFLRPMTEDLGWSRGDFALANTAGVVVSGITGFIIGPSIDRYGGRWLMVGGAIIAGLSLVSLSVVHELWQYLGIRGLFFVVGSAGMGPLVVNTVLSKWFVRQRGRAIAVGAMGLSAGGIVLAPLTVVLVESMGWRTAWVVLGALIWVVIVLPAALIMKRQPEDVGLLPDGDTPESLAAAETKRGTALSRSGAAEEHWTRGEAVRTRELWVLIAAFGLGGLPASAMVLHLIPFLQDNGFPTGVAALLFAGQNVTSLLSKPIWGYYFDTFDPRYLVALGWGLKAVPLLLLPVVAGAYGVPAVLALLMLYGVGVGSSATGQAVIWAHYFGRRHIGAVRSVAMPFTIVFGAGGTWFAGAVWDVRGSYTEAFVLFAALSLLAMVVIILNGTPKRRIERFGAERPSGGPRRSQESGRGMNQALRDTIQYHVGRGFELETLTPDNRATLVRDGEVLRLRMEGASVFLRHEAQPAPGAPLPGRSRLAIALLALSLIATLVLLIFAVLSQLREQPSGVDSNTTTPSAATPAVATPSATALALAATATAPPDTGTATPVVSPPVPTLLSVSLDSPDGREPRSRSGESAYVRRQQVLGGLVHGYNWAT